MAASAQARPRRRPAATAASDVAPRIHRGVRERQTACRRQARPWRRSWTPAGFGQPPRPAHGPLVSGRRPSALRLVGAWDPRLGLCATQHVPRLRSARLTAPAGQRRRRRSPRWSPGRACMAVLPSVVRARRRPTPASSGLFGFGRGRGCCGSFEAVDRDEDARVGGGSMCTRILRTPSPQLALTWSARASRGRRTVRANTP